MLKWIKTRKERIYQSGRSMIEMLGVLAIVGLLSIGGLWGVRLLYDKHRANNLLEDASMGLLLMEESLEEEGEIELDFTPESDYEITGVILARQEGRVDFVRALQVGRRICDVIKKMEIEDLFVYTFNEEGGSLVELEECQEENEMFFTYTDCGEIAPGCFPGCGLNAHCVDLYECECNEGYGYNEETDRCEENNGCGPGRPSTGPDGLNRKCCLYWAFIWDETENKCTCSDGHRWDVLEETCTTCSRTGETCQEYKDCCSSENFCAFTNPENDTTRGTGECTAISSYKRDTQAAFEKEFIRSTDMNWWTAQDWCAAQGYTAATRGNIGCGGVDGSVQCTSDIWMALMDGGWAVKNYDTERYAAWLEESNASAAYGIYYRDGGINGTSITGDWSNLYSRVDNHHALCFKNKCEEGVYWDSRNKRCIECNPSIPSEAFTKSCCEGHNWRWKNDSCVCECDEGFYCDASQKCVACISDFTTPSEITSKDCCISKGFDWLNNTCTCPPGKYLDNNTNTCECTGGLYPVTNYSADGRGTELPKACCAPSNISSAVDGVCCDSSKPYCVKVPYLESTGTQWIDTGIPENTVYKIEAEFKVIDLYGSSPCMVSGTIEQFMLCNHVNQTKAILYYRGGVVASTYYPDKITLPQNKYNTFVMGAGNVTVNGAVVKTYTDNGAFSETTSNLSVFSAPGGSRPSKMALKSLKIYGSGGSLVRNFTPVIDKDGKAGLYDEVSGTVFYNSGSGKFLAGE